MKSKDFLRRLTLEKTNVFFSAIRIQRAVDLRKRKESHSWAALGYKLYPSSIKSLYMCPKRYIEEDVHKVPDFQLETIYKMELGKTVHTLFQDKSLQISEEKLTEEINNLASDYAEAMDTYIKHMYQQEAIGFKAYELLYGRPRDLGPMLEAKMTKAWPEIPGYDEESGLSFRCDLVLKIDDYPAVIDIKTTSVDPDRWREQTKKYPLPEHKLQVRFYRHMFNSQRYFDKPIKKVGLGYINLLMEAGSEGSEFEVWEDLGEDEDTELQDLIRNLSIHRKAAMEGRMEDCSYRLCGAHNNANS